MKIIIEEINTKEKDSGFSIHHYTIRYKKGLFFWNRVEDDLIYGTQYTPFDSIRSAKNYVKKNILTNYDGDYTIIVKHRKTKYI
tara:strand:- start:149 stop:400 length:252 start_codon:yes stop_codon:yes gene_type:complete